MPTKSPDDVQLSWFGCVISSQLSLKRSYCAWRVTFNEVNSWLTVTPGRYTLGVSAWKFERLTFREILSQHSFSNDADIHLYKIYSCVTNFRTPSCSSSKWPQPFRPEMVNFYLRRQTAAAFVTANQSNYTVSVEQLLWRYFWNLPYVFIFIIM